MLCLSNFACFFVNYIYHYKKYFYLCLEIWHQNHQ